MEWSCSQLKTRFNFYESNPGKLDNQFLELCNFTDFVPDVFANKKKSEKDLVMKMMSIVFSKPELLETLMNGGSEEEQQRALMQAVAKDPGTFLTVMQDLV